MPRMTGSQFIMHSNMKASPTSQGTLFQGGNPTPANGGQPWPRRYSPQRRDEVVGAMRNADDLRDALKDPQPEGWSHEGGMNLGRQAHGISAIARSTVPVDHLRGDEHGGLKVSWGLGQSRGGDLGAYYQHGFYGTKKEPWGNGPDIAVNRQPGNEHTHTVIHEIGHHVSAIVDKNEHAAYNTPARRGTEEGYAENYAEKHYRDKAGKPIANFYTSHHGWSQREDDPQPFADAFEAKREDRHRGQGATVRPYQQQEELLHKLNSGGHGDPTYHWGYNGHAPDHLSRQITGRDEADRRGVRAEEREAALHGIRPGKNSPKFNVFPSGTAS